MYNESTETKSNGQETLETSTTAIKEILDEIKTELSTIQHLDLAIIKKLSDVLKLLDILKGGTRITFFTGPMCSGKSGKLVDKSKELKEQGILYQCYKPILSERKIGDTEDSATKINSRKYPDTSIEAVSLEQDFDVEILINSIKDNGYKVVMFEETQFWPEQKLKEFIEKSKELKLQEIIFAGLDMDFLGRKFAQFELLNEIAQTILLTANCSVKGCKEKATHTAKTGGNTNQQIEAGGEGMYQPCCYVHWRFLNILFDNKIIIDEELENKYSEEIKKLTDAISSFNKNDVIEFKDGKKICFNTKSHTCYSIQSK